MHFTKMHGIGNDFVMVDCLGPDGPALAREAQERAAFLNDRKFGVGGDGVILMLPGRAAPFQMRMFNPDGSEAEMCGNAIRCFAKYVRDRGLTTGRRRSPSRPGPACCASSPPSGPTARWRRSAWTWASPILRPADIPTTLGEGETFPSSPSPCACRTGPSPSPASPWATPTPSSSWTT